MQEKYTIFVYTDFVYTIFYFTTPLVKDENNGSLHSFYFGGTIYSQEHNTFITKLVSARKAAGISQVELAKALSSKEKTIPQKIISDIEVGQRRIDVIELIQLSRIIGFDAAKFIKELCKEI